jgi:hypothetical protein
LKVRSLFGSNLVARGLTAISLALALAAAGAAPLAAVAQTAAPAPASADTSATSSPVSSSATQTVVPAPVAPAPAPVRKLTVREIIMKIARAQRLSAPEISALMWIAKRESNFHPKSESRSECHGLFQLSKSIAHGHPWQDPAWNTARAIKYMKGRYGGVVQAKAFWSAHHWY